MNEAQFKQELAEKVYAEASTVTYDPNFSNDMHTHNFTTYLLVQSGTIILVTEEGSTAHQAGKICQLNSGIVHAEQAGSEGAVFLVGKNKAKACAQPSFSNGCPLLLVISR